MEKDMEKGIRWREIERMNKGEGEDAKRWEEQVHGDPDPPPGNTGGAATARLLSAAGPDGKDEEMQDTNMS